MQDLAYLNPGQGVLADNSDDIRNNTCIATRSSPTTRTYIRQPEANAGKRIHNGPKKAAAMEHVGPSVVAGDKTKRENNTMTFCRSMAAADKTKRENNTVTLCRSMVAADKTKRANNIMQIHGSSGQDQEGEQHRDLL